MASERETLHRGVKFRLDRVRVPTRDGGSAWREVAAAVREPGRQYVHAYWSVLDAVGHMHGMWTESGRETLLSLERAFAAFIEALAGTGTLVVATADHGQIDTVPGDWVSFDGGTPLGRHLAIPLCGEPRAAFCYPQHRAMDDFAAAVADVFRGAKVLHESDAWIADEWYGLGEPHPELASRTGAFVLVPPGNGAVKDWLAPERRYATIGVHGGTTAAEMHVPLIVTRA